MTCPSCRKPLVPGQALCPSCGANVAPAVEGALAPDASPNGPSPHAKTEPLREIPALRKRERTWKDEVRDRVKKRRTTRSGELPLFEPHEPEPDADPEPTVLEEPPALDETVLETEPAIRSEDRIEEPEALDLPFRREPVRDEPEPPEPPARSRASDHEPLLSSSLDLPEDEPSDEDSFSLKIPPPEPDPRPVERPALLGERLGAAAIDLTCLLALWALTLYFAGRISHAGILGLRPAWRYIAGYLSFVSAYYAVYFTGTTGQTLGKIVFGLRVVDTAGAPPGYVRALFRAVLAVIGISAAFLGIVPIFFDPARRALHDRVFRTRVVKG
jgi:uncharacterized RDD family membrane protein YckC